jgi:hypothetical protein
MQELIDDNWTPEMEHSTARAGGVTNMPDMDAFAKLRTAYLLNLKPEDMYGLDLSVNSNHPTFLSVAGLLNDGERDEFELAEIIGRLWELYGSRPPRAGEIDKIVAHTLKKKPCRLTLPDNHPDVVSWPWFDGLKIFSSQEAYDAHMKEKVYAEYKARIEMETRAVEPSTSLEKMEIRYPLEVWNGTAYQEYADRCSEGNFMPKEFHIEAMKTVVGSIAGGQMKVAGEGAGRSPRFYTVLMAQPGIGKNTAIDDFLSQFFHEPSEEGLIVYNPRSLLWTPQHDQQRQGWRRIGTCVTKTSSASGLAKFLPDDDPKVKRNPQPRLLFKYTELTELFEKMGIEGSGGAMMSVFCDLYDGVVFEVPALANQMPFGGSLMASLIAGVQPHRWDQICGGKGIEGSGIDERFNLIPTEEGRSAPHLCDRNFGDLKERFLAYIGALDEKPYYPRASEDAKRFMDEWYIKIRKPLPEEDPADPVSRGRLNLLAWKNALHYSWVMNLPTITVDAMERGCKLAEYQLRVRLKYRPLSGDSPVAKAANAISRCMRRYQTGAPVPLREVRRAVHATRMGPTFTGALTHLCTIKFLSSTEEGTGGQARIIVRRLED